MTKRNSMQALLASTAAALALAGCGGGGGGDPLPDPNVAGTDVPQAATTDPAAATAFVRGNAQAGNDSADPLRLGNAMLATSETAEPEVVAR
jgi:hypothetical protein